MSRNRYYDQRIVRLKERFKDNTALDILDNMQSVYEAKDNDYSATGLPMGNLRKCEEAGIDAWRGCLVRIGDKMSRLENFLKEKEYLVISEKAEDTVVDLANYAILMSCLLEELKSVNLSRYYNDITEQAQLRLEDLSYYCVFQAMLWKNNDTVNGLVFLEKALSFWPMLSDYSLEMQ
jgi:hypothetical protein